MISDTHHNSSRFTTYSGCDGTSLGAARIPAKRVEEFPVTICFSLPNLKLDRPLGRPLVLPGLLGSFSFSPPGRPGRISFSLLGRPGSFSFSLLGRPGSLSLNTPGLSITISFSFSLSPSGLHSSFFCSPLFRPGSYFSFISARRLSISLSLTIF